MYVTVYVIGKRKELYKFMCDLKWLNLFNKHKIVE